jgi:hypothetical protein
MKRRGIRSGALFSKSYLKKRTAELASPATRALTDSIGDWALKNIRLEGLPFRFKHHEYLRALYADTARHIALTKAAQVGGTTWALLKMIRACMNGLNGIYFFPTKTDVHDFSRTRVASLLADNPFLDQLMTDTDTVELKKIGDAFLYFRGTQSKTGMKSVPADMIVLDELDEMTPEAKKFVNERLAHSDYKRIIELSNPSLPDYGIDEVYQSSDQRHWHMKCPSCGAWTALEKEFPIKLGQEVTIILPRKDGSFYRACPKCQGELDVDHGEWVPDYEGRAIHGYRISQLFSSKVDPGAILEEYRTTRFPERFYRLDLMSVLSLCTDTLMLDKCDEPCLMGVDTGKALHAVILRPDLDDGMKHHLVHLAVCNSFSELDDLMARFKVDACVIDGLPETHATREFAQRHSGHVFMNFFNENQRGAALFDRHARTVQVNRTEALDASRAAIRDKRVVLPRRLPIVETFARHMVVDAKILDENKDTGAKKYRYIRTPAGAADHFSLAFTYAWIAASNQTAAWAHIAYWRRQVKKMKQGSGNS